MKSPARKADHNRKPAYLDEADAPRILIVEDDSNYALKMLAWLDDWEMPLFSGACRVRVAQNIAEASEYLGRDEIDIFIVDLIISDSEDTRLASDEIGKAFVKRIVEATNAGIIVHSSLAAQNESSALLNIGADDYIQKHSDRETIRARVLSLWRRIQLARSKKTNSFAHSNRTFLIGPWRFKVGDRNLTKSNGEVIRLSITEHAFLRYICTIESHACGVEEFNLHVMGRRNTERNFRVDNLIYRLRKKVREIEVVADEEGYRILDIKEIKRAAG